MNLIQQSCKMQYNAEYNKQFLTSIYQLRLCIGRTEAVYKIALSQNDIHMLSDNGKS